MTPIEAAEAFNTVFFAAQEEFSQLPMENRRFHVDSVIDRSQDLYHRIAERKIIDGESPIEILQRMSVVDLATKAARDIAIEESWR